jgi:hypothetical protein
MTAATTDRSLCVAVGDDAFLADRLDRYGFPRKLDRSLSANQNAKIAANERQK